MKNKIAFSLFLFCMLSQSLFGLCGDVDNSGSVNIVDALVLVKCYIGIGQCPAVSEGDVNCSGAIDVIDALRVAQYYVGIIAELSCCVQQPANILVGISAGMQCEPLKYESPDEAAVELTSNGIPVLMTATLSMGPVCAACSICPDGRIWAALIPFEYREKALALGWNEVAN